MQSTNTHSPCKLDGSRVASGLMLQKSNAAPIFGLTERPFFPHSDSSLYHGKELLFSLTEGNTVSPPSSTSELKNSRNQEQRKNCQELFQSKAMPS